MQKAVAIALLFTAVVAGSQNITVNETDTSQITLVNVSDAPICKLDSSGNIVGSQPGCYDAALTGCTDSVAMQQNAVNSSATFKFNGTAILINSLQFQYSPVYTVTLDGESTDVDGYANPPPNISFSCTPLFSKNGLDKTREHTIVLATKGRSQFRTDTQTNNIGVFSLISFVYTSDGNPNTTSSPSGTTTGSPSATGATNNSVLNAMHRSWAKVYAGLLVVLALGYSL
ncbi:hypothetical protein BDP27DRAFT_1328215 [Rhodocollybia butyracea]|uniref:Uncharacterized protein n=1 Tax=Rhodocollybia butyracea TaxID=206335 RepID=A0A9P5PLA0_9AGAR|nr:hypothetical protein BDP27DRAFT_1328215 [Rhodocollybia butyracea]